MRKALRVLLVFVVTVSLAGAAMSGAVAAHDDCDDSQTFALFTGGDNNDCDSANQVNYNDQDISDDEIQVNNNQNVDASDDDSVFDFGGDDQDAQSLQLNVESGDNINNNEQNNTAEQ